jgi:hypothetical protein
MKYSDEGRIQNSEGSRRKAKGGRMIWRGNLLHLIIKDPRGQGVEVSREQRKD